MHEVIYDNEALCPLPTVLLGGGISSFHLLNSKVPALGGPLVDI